MPKTLSDYILEAIDAGCEVHFLQAPHEMYKSVFIRVSKGFVHVEDLRTFAEIRAGQIDTLAWSVDENKQQLLEGINARNKNF